MNDISDAPLRLILERLEASIENPVTRARRLVELQVPVSRRGPGWDRHWRELEAYAEAPVTWSASEEGANGDTITSDDAPSIDDTL
jgi:hypothetical protein